MSKTITPETNLFATTRWSIVLRAAGLETDDALQALDQLCRIYWKPIYVYLRRSGCSVHQAEDLTQAFLAHLMSNHALDRLEPRKGKFRSYLLASLKHFLINERQREQAQKRGGDHVPISLDDPSVEELYKLEPWDKMTPEKLYERRWAMTLLERVRDTIQEDYAASGKLERFAQLAQFLPGEKARTTQVRAAQSLGISEGAFNVELHRLRGRFREQLRTELMNTVSQPEEVDEEVRYLIGVLSE